MPSAAEHIVASAAQHDGFFGFGRTDIFAESTEDTDREVDLRNDILFFERKMLHRNRMCRADLVARITADAGLVIHTVFTAVTRRMVHSSMAYIHLRGTLGKKCFGDTQYLLGYL